MFVTSVSWRGPLDRPYMCLPILHVPHSIAHLSVPRLLLPSCCVPPSHLVDAALAGTSAGSHGRKCKSCAATELRSESVRDSLEAGLEFSHVYG